METKNWTIRNIPTEVIESLKVKADENRRSLNNQMIIALEKASKEK